MRQPRGTGILVADNASPTILNNIFAYLQTGIQVQRGGGRAGPEIGHNLFQGNANNGTRGRSRSSPRTPIPNAVRGRQVRQLLLAERRAAIDSSLNRADDRDVPGERSSRTRWASRRRRSCRRTGTCSASSGPTTKTRIRWAAAPRCSRTAAPWNASILTRPSPELVDPADGDSLDVDPERDGRPTRGRSGCSRISRCSCSTAPAMPRPIEGTGVDAATVTPDTVSITQDGVLLVEIHAGDDRRSAESRRTISIRAAPTSRWVTTATTRSCG